MTQTSAAVLRQPSGKLTIETLSLDALRDDEALIRIAAAGICHTDHEAIHGNMPPPPPVVLGHEGAGIVERVGPAVTHVRPGDHVVLTFPSCGSCPACDAGRPVLCPSLFPLAIGGKRLDGSALMRDAHGQEIHSAFFGQSSFATYAIARAPNIVRVRDDVPFELLAPLGCGIQTGMGTVLNTIKPLAGSSIAIFGAGAVGLAAAIAARIADCGRILVADINPARLALALEIGASETMNVMGLDPAQIAEQIGPVAATVEASGNTTAIDAAVRTLATGGTCAMLGVSKPGTKISIDHGFLASSRRVVGVVQGDSDPQCFIPQLVGHLVKGRLPVDRLITTYAFDRINTALDDAAAGHVIKPVLLMPTD